MHNNNYSTTTLLHSTSPIPLSSFFDINLYVISNHHNSLTFLELHIIVAHRL
jgi:hypothetical protein